MDGRQHTAADVNGKGARSSPTPFFYLHFFLFHIFRSRSSAVPPHGGGSQDFSEVPTRVSAPRVEIVIIIISIMSCTMQHQMVEVFR